MGVRRDASTFKNNYVVLALLFLAVVISYHNVYDNAFLWDDNKLILQNENLKEPSKYSNFLRDFWYIDEVNRGSPYFRPLVVVTYIIDYNLWGENQFGYHLTNVVLMLLATLGAYYVIHQLLDNRGYALVAALLFAVHPVHTENVTWISGRTDLIMGIFYFFSLYCFMKYRESAEKKYMYRSFALGVCALLAKEVAVTLPLAMILYDWCCVHKSFSSMKRDIKLYLTFLTLPIIFFVARLWALGGRLNLIFLDSVVHSTANVNLFSALMKIFYSVTNYLVLTVFPYVLRIRWEIPTITSLFSVNAWFAFIGPCVLGYAIYTAHKKSRKELFLWLFFILNILLVINILTVRDAFAERFVFLSSLSICALFPLLLEKILKKKKTIMIVMCIVIVLFSVRTIDRNHDWQNFETLVGEEIKVNPHSGEANYLYASILMSSENESDHATGVYHLIRAIEIDDTRTDAHLLLGTLAANSGEYLRAFEHFEKCKVHGPPEYIWKGALNQGKLLMQMGFINREAGDLETSQKNFFGASENFKVVLQQKAYLAEFHLYLADAYYELGDYEGVAFELDWALEIEPENQYARAFVDRLEQKLNKEGQNPLLDE